MLATSFCFPCHSTASCRWCLWSFTIHREFYSFSVIDIIQAKHPSFSIRMTTYSCFAWGQMHIRIISWIFNYLPLSAHTLFFPTLSSTGFFWRVQDSLRTRNYFLFMSLFHRAVESIDWPNGQRFSVLHGRFFFFPSELFVFFLLTRFAVSKIVFYRILEIVSFLWLSM